MNELERAIDTCKQMSKQLAEHCADDLSITAVKALEKQVSKQVIIPTWGVLRGLGRCPNCNIIVETEIEKFNYCPDCGQKLHW